MRNLRSKRLGWRNFILIPAAFLAGCLSVSLVVRQISASEAARLAQSNVGSSTPNLPVTQENTTSQGGINDMLSSWLASNAVAQYPDAAKSLKERWAWGLAQSRQGESQSGFWMAYSIHRLLDSEAYVGTINVSALPPSSASRQKSRQSAKELWQDVVFLFNVQGRSDTPRRIEVNNRPWILDREKKPVVWIGRASEEESINLLLEMYRQVGARELKANIMVGAELHSKPEVMTQVAALLRKEAFAGTDRKLHTDVLDAISHLPNDLGTPLLVEIARTHPNASVREEAVNYLGESEDERAHEALKSLNRTP